ncbi:MAG TPA: glycosyl transferase [bacterium]|nr:glycosyl transferase [bacterium]
METIRIKRLRLMNVPVDAIEQELVLKMIERFLLDGEKHQIVFLNRPKLFKARRNVEYKRCLRDASLILPVSREIVRGVRFLSKGNLTRFEPFTFIVRLLAIVEKLNRTVYLLGSRKEDLEKTERNLKGSFPGLRIVGRFSGYFSKDLEKNVLLAIKKASPSVLMVGNGLSARDLWILRHKADLNPGIYLWVGDCFELFSGKKKASGKGFNPALIFPTLYFWTLLIIYKIFKR